jgi:hypothetical protein
MMGVLTSVTIPNLGWPTEVTIPDQRVHVDGNGLRTVGLECRGEEQLRRQREARA